MTTEQLKPPSSYAAATGLPDVNAETYPYDVVQRYGELTGLNVHQELRACELGFAVNGGLQSRMSIGPVIGDMSSNVLFNILNPGAPGTGLSPIPFQSINRFELTDSAGRPLGGFGVDGGEGRTFYMAFPQAPGQQGLRFGVFAPMVEGSGVFEGVHGHMTDNSAVGVASSCGCHVLRSENRLDGATRVKALQESRWRRSHDVV